MAFLLEGILKVSNRKSKGNTAEYILPAVLVGLVAVSGLAWIFQGENGAQAIKKVSQSKSVIQNSGQTALVSRSFGENPIKQSLSLRLASGEVIELKNVPINPVLSVEVDGGHGTLEQILASLDQLILALEGKVEPDTLNALKALATEGYGLADQQGVVEQFVAQCGTSKTCVQDALRMMENKSAASFIGFSSRYSQISNQQLPASHYEPHFRLMSEADWQAMSTIFPNYEKQVLSVPNYNFDKNNVVVGQGLSKFLHRYLDAQNHPTGSPAVDHLVRQLSSQIVHVSLATSSNLSTVSTARSLKDLQNNVNTELGSNPDKTPDQFNQLIAESMQRSLPEGAKEMTTTNSDVICQTGQGRHENGRCQ